MNKLLLMSLAAISITAAHGQENGVTDTEITLGAVLPMSGPASFTGIAADIGNRIALAEVNGKGGIHGRKVKILVEDDGYVPSRSYQGLVKLVDTGVLAIVGSSGAAGLGAMLPLIDQKKIPLMVSTSVSKAAVEPVRPYIFMVGAEYEDLFYAQMKYIHEHDKPKGPYAMIRQDDDYGALTELGFRRAVKEFSLPSVEPIRFKRGQKDFSAEVLKLRSENVGSIAIAGVIAETPAVLKEMSKFKMTIPTANPHTGNIDMTMKLSAPYGIRYYAADYVATIGSAEASAFRKLAASAVSPEDQAKMSRFTLTGYLGTKAVLHAIGECGRNVTRACLIEKLKATKDLDATGLTKPLDFSGPKNTAATMVQVVHVDPGEGKVTPLTGFVSYRR